MFKKLIIHEATNPIFIFKIRMWRNIMFQWMQRWKIHGNLYTSPNYQRQRLIKWLASKELEKYPSLYAATETWTSVTLAKLQCR